MPELGWLDYFHPGWNEATCYVGRRARAFTVLRDRVSGDFAADPALTVDALREQHAYNGNGFPVSIEWRP